MDSRHKNKIVRTTVSVLLSFLIAAALFAGVFAVELQAGWLNCSKLHQELSSNAYPYQMIDQMEEEIKELLETHAIGEAVVDNIWNEDELYRIFYGYSENVLLKGKTENNDTYRFAEKLKGSLEDMLTEQGAGGLDAVASEIDLTVADAAAIYQNYMYPGFLERFYRLADSTHPALYLMIVVSLIVFAASVAVLWKLYHYKHHAAEYIAAGFLTGTVWNFLAVLFVGNGGWIASAGIGPEFYRNLIEGFLKSSLQIGIMVTGIELLLFLVLWTRIRISRKG